MIAIGVITTRACHKQSPRPYSPLSNDCKRGDDSSSMASSMMSSPPNSPPVSPSFFQPSYTFSNAPPRTRSQGMPLPWHRVIVIMSNHLTEVDIQVVYAFIKVGLEELGIEVEIYDPGVAGCCVSVWLDKVLRNCSKIICVCNKQFMEEWDGQNTEGSPVHALGIMVRSYINQGKYPTELFMVTVLREEDKQYIPYYVASAVPYRVEQTDEIYRAITGESKYQ